MRELDDLRLDRILIRLVIAASFVASALAATGITSDRHPTVVAQIVGVAAGVVTVAGFVTGGAWWGNELQDNSPEHWKIWQLWAMSFGSVVTVVALPFGGLVWFPYLPVVTSARAFDLPRVIRFSSAPILGLCYLALHQQGRFATLGTWLSVVRRRRHTPIRTG